ncbi:MAG: hypothetical protein K2H30_03955, partial [Clostridia bacterium]|nr:hypothetical protein [Clostridia bacterium]
CMYGWGIHFVANDNNGVYPGSGKSFEVRNITFANYPEDAIGMEGTQGTSPSSPGGANASSNYLLAPVERCWIHNNVFLPGYCSKPAESDKAEGDGSCDFKRGQYYTLAYNYFEYCHKTNLIGSADASLTYNVTMHHNYWYNCGSRQPLARRANIHFYNNYIFGDATDSSASLSYVSSFRANCLLFSEANYFDGSKNVTQKKDGVGVAWNNIYYACSGENLYTEISSRTETVANSCAYIKMNIDYSKFYVNSEQFYYDSANKVSNCLLDSATGARVRVMTSAGVNGFGVSSDETHINKYTPSAAVNVGSQGLEINLEPIGKAKVATTVSNIYFAANNGWSNGLKIRGQGITFTLTAPTEIVVSSSSTGDLAPELIDVSGRAWATKFTGTLTLVLPKGTYVIASGQKDKDSYITGLSFADTEASSDARVESANAALAAIPSSVTLNDEVYIKAAQAAYSALRSDEQNKIDSELYEKLGKAITAINQLKAEYVIARIDYIGTVTIDSYNKITAAQTAYSELSASLQSHVTNYSTLTAAWTTYGEFAAQNVINKILDLPEVENIQKINSFEILDRAQIWFDAVTGAFDGLTSEEGQGQQGQVKAHDEGKTYARLTDGLEALDIRRAELEQAAAEAEALENFIAALEGVTNVDNLSHSDCTAIVHLYNSLSEEKQAEYADNETYKAVSTKYDDLSKQAITSTFIGGQPSASVFTHTGSKQNAKNTKFVVHAYSEEQITSGLKFEASTELTLTITTKMTVTFYLYDSNSLAIDGTALTVSTVDGDNVATVTLEAGTYKITRAKSEASLYYATLTPAG